MIDDQDLLADLSRGRNREKWTTLLSCLVGLALIVGLVWLLSL